MTIRRVKFWLVIHRKSHLVSAKMDGQIRAYTLETEAQEARKAMRLRRQHRVIPSFVLVKVEP